MVADPFGWIGHALDDRYRALTVAGEGGFGVVYRGHHIGLDVPVAIKCLKLPQSLGPAERDAFEKRFTEEGRVLHRLSRASATVVQALDVGSAMSPSGIWTPYLVLEWLEGRSLETEMRERARRGEARWPVAEAIELLTPAARALGEAHAQRVAHRDVKPANLFLTKVGGRQVLKVLDFGIAKVVQDSLSHSQALQMTGQAPPAFTPRYGAPEQFDRRKGATGPWTDVHALALVLVELVTGKPALDGEDVVQLMACALDREHRPTPRAHGIDVGEALEGVLERALALLPEDRFATVPAFWREVLAAVPEADADEDQAGLDQDAALAPLAEADANVSTADYLDVLRRPISERPAEPEPVATATGSDLDTGAWLARRAAGAKDDAPEPARSAEPPTAGSTSQDAALVTSPRPSAAARWRVGAVALVALGAVALLSRSWLPGPEAPTAETAATPAPVAQGLEPSATSATTEEIGASPSAEPVPTAAEASEPVATSAVPRAATSAPPSAAAPAKSAVAAASSAELIAPADYCEASCRVDGECTATLIGHAVVCRATSDAHCKKTYSCTVHGACWARGGRCVATSADDCAKSLGCKQTGECAFRNGKCLQELITDCTKYPVCKELGMCTARANACWATTDADCKASNTCSQFGNCRTNGSQCVP